MKNILEIITANKKEEISERRKLKSLKDLEKQSDTFRTVYSLKKILLEKNEIGIIAEFKRKSPSKGIINNYSSVEEVTKGYIKSGASALSVLTDTNFFGGNMEDLRIARRTNDCPILRKDFIVDEYQIFESKAIGADVILLIASILTSEETLKLASLAKHIGLEVVLEIHNEEEMNHINEFVDIVGINNRNLIDFTVSLEHSLNLCDLIPNHFIKISESGIDTAEKLLLLKRKGFQGFLMGEIFMSNAQPERACADFIRSIKYLEKKY